MNAVRQHAATSKGLLKFYIITLVAVPLAATIYALVAFSWYRGDARDIVLFAVFYTLAGFGISIGYHRMLTHRGFESHPAVKAVFLMLGCMAVEQNPIRWAATHIRHHAHADKEGDPHSPMQGLFHAHVGWLARHDSYADPNVYVPHLVQDPLVRFFDRTTPFWYALSFALPLALGGWSGLLWGGLVRVFFTHHVTWSVNSICHMFGSRPFRTTDDSSNNWIVGLLGFGEGWHNNHHAFPQSAFHGLKPWQVDFSSYLIRLLRRLGLVRNVVVPTPMQVALRSAERVPERVSVPAL